MANMTTTSQVGPAVDTYYDKLLLARARPYLIHTELAQKRPLPAKSGDIIKFRRYTNLSTATTPLTEGISPAGQSLDKTDMIVRVEQFGDYVTITDKVQYVVEDQVLNESTDLLSQQMGETMDELVRDMLASTASAYSCVDGVNLGTPTEITSSDIQAVVKTLMRNSAKMFTPMIEGANKFGTSPVRQAFWALAHTDIQDDLEACSNFLSKAQYPSQDGVMDAEWGSTGNVRWMLSPLGYVSAGTYSAFIVGRDAYGIVELKEGTLKNVFKPYGHGNDPLDQRCTMGWKTMFASRVLNDLWLVNCKCTHS